MSRKNLEEWKKLSTAELNERLEELKNVLLRLRIQWKLGQLKNTSSIKETKKDIARLMTLMCQKMMVNSK